MSRAAYTHKFVKAFPDKLDEGTLYVSVEFGTAAHLCFCGCRSEVYTRFSPRDWSMRFNGETVSVSPSIGNWSFDCQSHYILDGGRVHWADKWSRERIELGRLLYGSKLCTNKCDKISNQCGRQESNLHTVLDGFPPF